MHAHDLSEACRSRHIFLLIRVLVPQRGHVCVAHIDWGKGEQGIPGACCSRPALVARQPRPPFLCPGGSASSCVSCVIRCFVWIQPKCLLLPLFRRANDVRLQ